MPSRRKSSRSTAPLRRLDKIKEAIKRVQDFYEMGQKSLKKFGRGHAYGKMETAAKDLGVYQETLRRARVLADPEHGGYSNRELKALYRLMRQYQAPIGPSHVIRLISIADRAKRARLQLEAAKHKWTTHRLDAEIRWRFGRRQKKAGRTHHLPDDAPTLRYEFLRLSTRWRGLYDAMLARENAPESRPFRKLEKSELKALEQVGPAMANLVKKLSRGFPGG